MLLYQYTTIDALSLILKNRKIRFSRLDMVDDPEEYGFERYGFKVAPFVFVSCWTPVKEENIPMWRMYANQARGVRIGVDSSMFELFSLDKSGTSYIISKEFFGIKITLFSPLWEN